MAFVRRPCAVALLACAAAFLVAAVGAQPADPSGKPLDPNPFLTDPDVEPVYMSPGAPSQWVSCYDRSNPAAQGPICRIEARQCPRGCPDLCYVHCPTCKLVCSKNTHAIPAFHLQFQVFSSIVYVYLLICCAA
jgi:hypothetical protein